MEFGDEKSSDSESGSVFREAPAPQHKSGQLALMTYSHRKPGRLAARLLMKMRSEVALGAAGAQGESSEKTPPTGVQYLLTILLPQLGAKAHLRTQRELRTLMVSLDLLARNKPSQGGGCDLPASQSAGKSQQRGDLGERSVPGVDSSRELESSRERRGGLHQQGGLARAEAAEEGQSELMERRRPSSRSQRRERKRERSQRRGRSEGEWEGRREDKIKEAEASPAAAVDPRWPKTLKEFGSQSRSMLEVLGQVWKTLPSMGTPMGKLAQSMVMRGVPPDDKIQKARGQELLPLNPWLWTASPTLSRPSRSPSSCCFMC